MKSKIILAEGVANTGRKFGAGTFYYPVMVHSIVTGVRPALFTREQIAEARKRADDNPEDVPAVTPWWRFW